MNRALRLAWPALAAALGGALAACTVGPDYQEPQMAAPPSFAEAAPEAGASAQAVAADLSAWWTAFEDPELNDLIRRGLAGSPDIESATSRVREARLQQRIAAANELPTVDASGNVVSLHDNHKFSSGSGSGSGSRGGGLAGLPIPSDLNLYSAGFDATWELDIFGGGRRSVEAAKAEEAAAQWSLRDAEVSLASEIAGDYLSLREAQARIAIGEAELQRQKDLFALIQARRRSGFVTGLDVNQQSSLVATAAAQIPQLEAQAKAQIHALGVLLGETPEALSTELAPPRALPAAPPEPAAGLPSDLLRRRPDVRAAERRLAAANARIGVQVANLFPKVNLIGLAAFASPKLDELFSSSNFAEAGVGMISEPIFNAGRTRAGIGAAKEERLQAFDDYRTTALGAFRDVEDALARYDAEETRRGHLAEALAAAENSLAISKDQYRVGLVNFINVLQAQNTVLNSQDQLTQSQAQSLTDLVSLYKALGGGWSA
ncbi:MAG: efflux transporter outer membrane subunit [Caulobacteraceae bacterium]|nr:efflux transporter outer membrane subunit [Caulobacteraceae bacterium]